MKPSVSVRNLLRRCLSHRQLLWPQRAVHKPYIKSLISIAGLQRDSKVLDLRCGQAFFAKAFADEGMGCLCYRRESGRPSAGETKYGRAIAAFVSDLRQPATNHQFACVFIRSCSLYNTDLQDGCATMTEGLLSLIRPGGLLIHVYNTSLRGTSASWRHHSFDAFRLLASLCLPSAELYFINGIDTLMLGRYAFNKVVTTVNRFICERIGLGGEMILSSASTRTAQFLASST